MSTRTRRDLCVIQRPTGELAISTPSMSGPNRRRNDMIVVERSRGDLKIVKRHPKPQRALTVIQPHVTILPPAPSQPSTILTVSSTTRRTSWGEETYVRAQLADGWPVSDASTLLLTAVLNFLTRFGR
jgi:hypothetical protein